MRDCHTIPSMKSGPIRSDQQGRKRSLGRNLTQGMLDTLGRAIVTGQYQAAPFPTEAQIAEAHGVSRSVTREAVKMLTAKGLVSALPWQGTVVQPASLWNLFDADVLRWMLDRKLSVKLLQQFSQLRIAIEPEAAALAAAFHSPAELKAIKAGLALMRAAEAAKGDLIDADIAFHSAILRASGNPFYAHFQTVVAAALTTANRLANPIKEWRASIEDYVAVADAITAHDADSARHLMRRVVGDVLDQIVSESD